VSSPPVSGALVSRHFERANAAAWDLTRDQFETALTASVAHAFAGREATAADIERYLDSLHVGDLAVAAACAAGSERAWDHFVTQYRAVLYRAADAIDPGGSSRELADGLYADLYGLQERAGVRQSLFRYFHGRSTLATWLRAVLAQRFVDTKRTRRKVEPLDEAAIDGTRGLPAATIDPDAARLVPLLRAALADAVARLPARDRLRLACYYAQDQTLAAIGRQLKEHEATVSRHIARTRQEIRAAVEHRLREEHGLDPAAIELCWRSALADSADLDIGAIMGTSRKDPPADRSKRQEGV
jgi:RNA polymerase sigma factor (sigma-70 family)